MSTLKQHGTKWIVKLVRKKWKKEVTKESETTEESIITITGSADEEYSEQEEYFDEH